MSSQKKMHKEDFKYVPRGKSIAPHCNMACARALVSYLSYYLGLDESKPTECTSNTVESFLVNLSGNLKRVEDILSVREKRQKEGEIARMLREQAQDAKETGIELDEWMPASAEQEGK